MKNVYKFDTYKDFLREMLISAGKRGQLTRAAEALHCQRSYLSRVIAEGLHLTPDHAFKLALFLRLSADECEYFQTLVDFERAGDPQYRAHLQQRLAGMKRQHESVQQRAARADFSLDTLQVSYFSTWLWSALHFLTSIPAYQSLEALANRLGARPDFLRRHLEQLAAQGFVEERGGRWFYKKGEFHAPKDSPLVVLHHQNWRARAVQDAQDITGDSIHFTAVQTVSKKDFERIKGLLLNFIEEASRIAGPSQPEEGIAITCDVFKI